ncbi:kinase-like domain-containing protein [Hygrophoropsis aurantiaca]|uniref:Kinase-like domain-containing protein n=1 Tax=Hygrophoropsis aurantiaca TaxID=72124 RepID=A0ACB8AEV8_9AGAM|nr:kinase-like domain-containing protein [Hygrophoropsis aurantiaca]
MSDAFDVIPFEDIKGDWKKLGSGSFGNVYKGSYLGIDVAIKEVLPSTSYDVAKYFEREWRLMKEARHPNVVLYLGLSRAPTPDGRIFIISEYIENSNLRQYIYDKNKPFPWRLRLSFATDIARALAYLHARKCIHRDLKGENLLVTANGRLKITDFGFARIAARNEEESKRLTFCGTDSYMSPEILLGEEFDLPTDIFSLGVIFCEIAARKLADDRNFKRSGPDFGIDEEQVRELASKECPKAFLDLCLDCVALSPAARPTTRVILERLRDIEAEVLLRPDAEDLHVGSVKLMTGNRRPGAAPRIPSFGEGIGKGIRHASPTRADELLGALSSGEESDDDDEIVEAISGLNVSVHLNSGWSDATNGHSENSTQPLLSAISSTYSDYSTTVVRAHGQSATDTVPPSLSSILTIRPSPDPNAEPATPGTFSGSATSESSADAHASTGTGDASSGGESASPTSVAADSILSMQTYHTAHSSLVSIAAATKGYSSIRSVPLLHRFTLIRPGAKRAASPGSASPKPARHNPLGQLVESGSGGGGGWNPLERFFSSGLLVQKCDICAKRIGWKPVLECDDCGLRAHIKCGEIAPRDCGIRPVRHAIPTYMTQATSIPANANLDTNPATTANTKMNIHSASPLSKLKQNAKRGGSPGPGAAAGPR